MPWVEALSDTQELRHCIRDLVALSTLPAIWREYDPQQIADSVASALISMIRADFIYIALPGRRNEPMIEIMRTGAKFDPHSANTIQKILRGSWLGRSEQTAVIANPVGEGKLRIVAAPIGFSGDAILAAGSTSPNFPTEVQRLLLGIGANDATIALQRWQAEVGERRSVTLIERSSEFIGFATMDGAPQYINPAGLNIVGLSGMNEASQLHVLDFVVPEQRKRAQDEFWPIVTQTGRWVGEIQFRHFQTGAKIPFLVDWFRIDDPRTGQPMNIATVSRDLTNQKRAEAELRDLNALLEQRVSDRTAELKAASDRLCAEMMQRERVDARLQELQLELLHASRLSAAGQMAAALAHELNQPLTAIANSVAAARRELARRDPIRTARVCEAMEDAGVQSLRAGQIIRRLRDFVARGETEKRMERLPSLIEEASILAVMGSGTLDVPVRFQFDPDATEVFANRIQLQQVLINLIRNSLESMAGRAHRDLTIATKLHEDATIEVVVADRGAGIPTEIADHLFEPFVSAKRDGMGLGLSLCRSIVEAHGGKLWTEPNPGGGTIFRFTVASAEGGNDA
jgi:PAS domain S-box-containing protein